MPSDAERSAFNRPDVWSKEKALTFTDEDLKSLKANMLDKTLKDIRSVLSSQMVLDVIARLEAAEKAARWFNSLKVDDENSEPYKDYIAWRKSCGRE